MEVVLRLGERRCDVSRGGGDPKMQESFVRGSDTWRGIGMGLHETETELELMIERT